jgi:uncharacterized membrane protein
MAEVVVIALLILAIPVISIVALVMTLNARDGVRRLESRVAALEATHAGPPGVVQTAEPAPAAPTQAAEPPPIIVEPVAAPEIPEPVASAMAAPASARATLEERFGTQWVVWIGGLALALGAIFLVRYTVEMGLLGPGVRIFLAAIFSALLITAGEWARRNEVAAGIVPIPSQHIPGILTAAGTVAAYATVYAAFALYGFLSPASAFILLGLVALATLAAALLHGPALAGLGVVGAFVTPVLVSTGSADYWALYFYLAVVMAAAFTLARMRLWRWLAVTATAMGVLWTWAGAEPDHIEALTAHLFHVVAGFALAAALIVSGLKYGPPAEPGKIDGVSSGSIGAFLFAAAFLVINSDHDSTALAVFTLLSAATVAITWRTDAALWALPAAGVFTAAVMIQWAAPEFVETLLLSPGVTRGAIPDPPAGATLHLVFGAALAVIFGLPAFATQGRTATALNAQLWSLTGVVVPIVILIALYLRIANLDRSIPFALLALAFGRTLRLRDRISGQTTTAAGPGVGSGHLRGGRGCLARAGADIRARQGLAHRRARIDGARHRMDFGAAALARAALSGGGYHCRCAVARRLRAAHRWPRRRHDADLQLATLRVWRAGRIVLVCGLSAAPTRRRYAHAPGRSSRNPVHGSARAAANSPLHEQWRHLPAIGSPGGNRHAGFRRVCDGDRARAPAYANQ